MLPYGEVPQLFQQKRLAAAELDGTAFEPRMKRLDARHLLAGILDRLNWRVNPLLLASPIQEDILLLENERLSRIPEYKLRKITGETDWDAQRGLWNKLLQAYAS